AHCRREPLQGAWWWMERRRSNSIAADAGSGRRPWQSRRIVIMPSREISSRKKEEHIAGTASDRHSHQKFERLVATAQRQPPVTIAIAHPCDQVSLESAVEAAKLKLIVPILVGPAARIREVASSNALDISAFEIVDAEH